MLDSIVRPRPEPFRLAELERRVLRAPQLEAHPGHRFLQRRISGHLRGQAVVGHPGRAPRRGPEPLRAALNSQPPRGDGHRSRGRSPAAAGSWILSIRKDYFFAVPERPGPRHDGRARPGRRPGQSRPRPVDAAPALRHRPGRPSDAHRHRGSREPGPADDTSTSTTD